MRLTLSLSFSSRGIILKCSPHYLRSQCTTKSPAGNRQLVLQSYPHSKSHLLLSKPHSLQIREKQITQIALSSMANILFFSFKLTSVLRSRDAPRRETNQQFRPLKNLPCKSLKIWSNVSLFYSHLSFTIPICD